VRRPGVRVRLLGFATVAAAAVAGCTGTNPAAEPPTSQSPAAGINSSSAEPPLNARFGDGRTAPVCEAASLHLIVHGVSEATQQESRLFEIVNSGQSTCALDGYPLVTLQTGRGTGLAFTTAHSGDQMVTSARPRPVELLPSHSAWVMINQNACVGRQQSAPAMRANLELPARRSVLAAHIGRYPIIAECLPADAGRILQVSPIKPTSAAASGHP
jgi:hypothetical protein